MKIKARIEFLSEKGESIGVKPWETPLMVMDDLQVKNFRNAVGSIVDGILRIPQRFPQPPEKGKGPDLADAVA
jgi:hypothetical protein